MRKLIAAINMTLDGYCDHTAGIADDEIHEHYNELLKNAGLLIYGRVTYQLMESYWPAIVKAPTGNRAIDDFAALIDNVPKMVYSRTLESVNWGNTILKNELRIEEVKELKKQEGKPVFVGSPGLIAAFTGLNLFDEYQLCIHPVILGNGLPLFKNISEKTVLKLLRTKVFRSGVVLHCYEPAS